MSTGVTLDATLSETPQGAADGSVFPSTTTNIPFALNSAPNAKFINVSTGRMLRTINSPSSFATLEGIGTGDTVQQATTLYVRVKSGGFQVRVTFNNPAAPSSPIVSILPLAGVLVIEPDSAGGFYPTKVEVQGSGTVEIYGSGAS